MLDEPLTMRHLVIGVWAVAIFSATWALGMLLGELAWWWDYGSADRAVYSIRRLFEPKPLPSSPLTDKQRARLEEIDRRLTIALREVSSASPTAEEAAAALIPLGCLGYKLDGTIDTKGETGDPY